ncbi:hypothetical protein [Denitrobaculum tricleocarpae]|uniref:Cytochrome c domain-containing protein n=1 Tax=Denitrobaculum tricleocarpae TaxID=2591009 RepID=A0A545T7U6_9PROT|nr:hypothetical protein [Denitrobaculum tricleocarpae]TQV73281.1 hypothetical protein FKG95_25000 [Denitrobaculum tricleocarpae]
MKPRFSIVLALLFPFLAAAGPSAVAQSADPHDLYEQRCAGCHSEHAGEFVQESVLREDGKLMGRDGGMSVRALLSRGHGKLTPAQVEVVLAHFHEILDAGALFRDNCVICHGRAVLFARSHLGMKDGVLVGRYSDRAVDDFLKSHGRLEGSEISAVVKALSNQVTGETYRLN